MYNSAIIRKKCSCGDPECNRWPTFGCAGKNYNCLPEEKKREIGTRRKISQRKKAYDNTQNRMLHIAQRKVNEGAIKLVLWFKYQTTVSKKECENCGASLENYNEADWFSSQHHIVDKSHINGCPSVASHHQNHLVLGKWCCHHTWHQSFEASSKMPVFSEAKRKFQLFKDDIAPDEARKVNPYLLN